MQNIIITNNPRVNSKIKNSSIVVHYFDLSYLDILLKARDMVHSGHTLLTHPIVSSIKPNAMPYKTVVLSPKKNTLDLESLDLIEKAIGIAKDFLLLPKRHTTQAIEEDLQLIDYDLIYGSIQSIL